MQLKVVKHNPSDKGYVESDELLQPLLKDFKDNLNGLSSSFLNKIEELESNLTNFADLDELRSSLEEKIHDHFQVIKDKISTEVETLESKIPEVPEPLDITSLENSVVDNTNNIETIEDSLNQIKEFKESAYSELSKQKDEVKKLKEVMDLNSEAITELSTKLEAIPTLSRELDNIKDSISSISNTTVEQAISTSNDIKNLKKELGEFLSNTEEVEEKIFKKLDSSKESLVKKLSEGDSLSFRTLLRLHPRVLPNSPDNYTLAVDKQGNLKFYNNGWKTVKFE